MEDREGAPPIRHRSAPVWIEKGLGGGAEVSGGCGANPKRDRRDVRRGDERRGSGVKTGRGDPRHGGSGKRSGASETDRFERAGPGAIPGRGSRGPRPRIDRVAKCFARATGLADLLDRIGGGS